MLQFYSRTKWWAVIGWLGLLAACRPDEGELLSNQPPSTVMALDRIELTGEDRLNSVVTLNWFGTDVDGFVIGYEISNDGFNWSFTTRQDSTFRFPITGGVDTADVDFYVRAIDNEQLADPNPAFLRIPIRNTPPTIVFLFKETLDGRELVAPPTNLPVFSFEWRAQDLDGFNTIDSVFFKLNEGPWYAVSRNVNLVTLVADDPTVTGPTSASVFANLGAQPLPAAATGLRLADSNRVFIRVRDIAGGESEIDTSEAFFVRPQTSDLLVIDANNSSDATAANPDVIYSDLLDEVYPAGYDVLDLNFRSGENQPKYWNPTFTFTLALYDKVFWYADRTFYPDATIGRNALLLESAAQAVQDFLSGGGKLFFTGSMPNYLATLTSIPNTINPDSRLFQFTAMDSLSSSGGQARFARDSLATSPLPGFPNLQPNALLSSQNPFYPKADADVVYRAALTSVGNWTGPNVVAARRRFSNGQVNQYFFTLELHRMQGQPDNLAPLFDRILNQEFDW